MHSHYLIWKYFRTLLIWHTNKEISLTFDGALNCRAQGVKEQVPLKGTCNLSFTVFRCVPSPKVVDDPQELGTSRIFNASNCFPYVTGYLWTSPLPLSRCFASTGMTGSCGHRLGPFRPSFKLLPPAGSPQSSLNLRLGLEPPRYLNSSNYFPYVPLALPHIFVDRSCWTLLHPRRGGASFPPTYTRLSLGEHCIDLDSCLCTAPRGRLVHSRCQISADVARYDTKDSGQRFRQDYVAGDPSLHHCYRAAWTRL